MERKIELLDDSEEEERQIKKCRTKLQDIRMDPDAKGGSDSEPMNLEDNQEVNIKIVTSDNKTFYVNKKWAAISKLIVNSLGDDDQQEIRLSAINSAIFKDILTYMEMRKGTEAPLVMRPLKSAKMCENCQDMLDVEYIEKIGENKEHLKKIIVAANYMDIQGLLYLSSAKYASTMYKWDIEKIQNEFQTRS